MGRGSLNFLQLGHAQCQPLFARTGEFDFGCGGLALALQRQHHAFAKFGVKHRVANLQAQVLAGQSPIESWLIALDRLARSPGTDRDYEFDAHVPHAKKGGTAAEGVVKYLESLG